MPLTYAFDHDHEVEPRDLTELLGGKGAHLAEMTSRLRLPVPPGFTVTTDAWRLDRDGGWPAALEFEVGEQLRALEDRTGRRLGDPTAPLLLSVRSGAPRSMPGMMDTVLNVGVSERTLPGLVEEGGSTFAHDTYRRFLLSYATIVLGAHERDLGPEIVGSDPDALWRRCEDLRDRIGAHLGEPFDEDAERQTRAAVAAVFRSWHGAKARTYRAREAIPDDLGTAANVQAMVFGNRDDRSATGVVFTRDPTTGENRRYGDVLFEAQGEDVVSGAFVTQPYAALADRLPSVATELDAHLGRLEEHYRDMCDVEFTIESGRLWILQTRVGKRSAQAAVRIAVELAEQDGWSISRAEATARVTDDQLAQVVAADVIDATATPIGTGLAASPGVATGRLCFTAEDCLDAAADESVILVRTETSPEDVHGMQVAAGILTTHGGLVSHAAVVARDWGLPAVVSLQDAHIAGDVLTVGDTTLTSEDVLTIDGGSGRVFLGTVEVAADEQGAALGQLLGWRSTPA